MIQTMRSGSRPRRFTAAGLALVLMLELFGAVLLDWAAPRRASALLVADDLALMGAYDAAINAIGGEAAAGAAWNNANVSQRAKAGLTTLVAKAGLNVHDTLMEHPERLPAILGVTMIGMQAKNTWTSFVNACESATAYGGYLWANMSSAVGGIWDYFAIQHSPASVRYEWPSVTNYDSSGGLLQRALGASVDAMWSSYYGGYTAQQVICMQQIIAAAQGAHTSGRSLTIDTVGIRPTAGGDYLVKWALRDGVLYYYSTMASSLQSWVSAIQSTVGRIEVAGDAAVIDEVQIGTLSYPTNPDVLPIPVEADTPAIANPTIDDIGAIDFPTTANPVPWAPPLWIPRVAGLDLSGTAQGIQDILDSIANGIPTGWEWLLSPFTGILAALKAILGWLDALIAWAEAQIANIFSPSWEAIQAEFGPRWNSFKSRMGNVWPFAVMSLGSLVVGSFGGGNLGGGRQLATTWHIVLIKIGTYEVSFDMRLNDLTDAVDGYRGWLVAVVWISLAGAVFWLFTPRVVT